MKPLLLLHGALATKMQFDSLLPLLKDHYKADAINFSGHGGFSIPVNGYNFNQFAKDILHYADTNKIDRLNLFGFSMGGYAALYFAKLHPDRVEKIFTMNVKFNWDPLSTAKETSLLDAEKMVVKVPGYANQLMMQHGLNLWKQVIDQTSKMMEQLSKELILLDEDYAKLKIPVLLSIGDRDYTSSVEETLHVFRKLPNARLWVMPDTSHPFEKIDSDKIADAIKRFI